jgi:hypothetical protein
MSAYNKWHEELVEHVAKAIYGHMSAEEMPLAWNSLPPWKHEEMREIARSALRAVVEEAWRHLMPAR